MTVPSTADIRARLEALCALVPGITKVLVTDDKTLPDDALPAIEVLIGQRVQRRTVDSYSSVVTYDWELWLFVERVEKPSDWREADAAIDLCDDWIDAVPDFFKARPRLALDDEDLVPGTGEMTIARGIFPYRGNGYTYAGLRFVLPVSVYRSSSIDFD